MEAEEPAPNTLLYCRRRMGSIVNPTVGVVSRGFDPRESLKRSMTWLKELYTRNVSTTEVMALVTSTVLEESSVSLAVSTELVKCFDSIMGNSALRQKAAGLVLNWAGFLQSHREETVGSFVQKEHKKGLCTENDDSREVDVEETLSCFITKLEGMQERHRVMAKNSMTMESNRNHGEEIVGLFGSKESQANKKTPGLRVERDEVLWLLLACLDLCGIFSSDPKFVFELSTHLGIFCGLDGSPTKDLEHHLSCLVLGCVMAHLHKFEGSKNLSVEEAIREKVKSERPAWRIPPETVSAGGMVQLLFHRKVSLERLVFGDKFVDDSFDRWFISDEEKEERFDSSGFGRILGFLDASDKGVYKKSAMKLLEGMERIREESRQLAIMIEDTKDSLEDAFDTEVALGLPGSDSERVSRKDLLPNEDERISAKQSNVRIIGCLKRTNEMLSHTPVTLAEQLACLSLCDRDQKIVSALCLFFSSGRFEKDALKPNMMWGDAVYPRTSDVEKRAAMVSFSRSLTRELARQSDSPNKTFRSFLHTHIAMQICLRNSYAFGVYSMAFKCDMVSWYEAGASLKKFYGFNKSENETLRKAGVKTSKLENANAKFLEAQQEEHLKFVSSW